VLINDIDLLPYLKARHCIISYEDGITCLESVIVKITMRLLLLFLLNICIGQAFAQVYSNLIIFGDSQSDIGNMPESSNANSRNASYYQGLPYNLYVPISNPVYGDQNTPLDLPYQKLFNTDALPTQPMINHSIRAGRSVNWSQYLFSYLKGQERLDSAALIPWVELYDKASISQNISVNYAFSGALSNDRCADEDYQPMPNAFCTDVAIFNTQNIYRLRSYDDELQHSLAIPGVQRQIALFRTDLQAHLVHVDDHTLYIIWTGANDLTDHFFDLLQGGSLKDFYTGLTSSTPDLIAGFNDSAVLQLYHLGARNIIVLSQQNLGLTPKASLVAGTSSSFMGRYLSAYAFDLLTVRYNIALAKRIVALQQHYPDLNLHYVDLDYTFNRLSLSPGAPFFNNLGLACQNKDARTYKAIVHGDLVTCTDYLYWNAAHMTYQGNRIIAEQIIDAIK
jgi:phospholipase/lecithinase/hemolysin